MECFTKTKFFLLLEDASRSQTGVDAQVLKTGYGEFTDFLFSGHIAFKFWRSKLPLVVRSGNKTKHKIN